ncbi:MAG: ABC transporter permease [Gemmataceae bacterium]|nr:ABC transporter permease [Gemmataceae bacterium]
MTPILVRKLLRDIRPALVVVCVLLFGFSALWVKVTQRVTAEITPFVTTVTTFARLPPELFEKVIFKGPGKVSQAVLGGADLRFDQATDFLAVELLHPVVLILATVWAVGRAAGAVAGEVDKGTMELLMSQPVPRDRLILAHLLVDAIVIPLLCLSVYAGTQFGFLTVGPFVEDYAALKEFNETNTVGVQLPVPAEPREVEVSGTRQPLALVNLAALIFALSGLTMALSAAGRSRWRVVGYGVLVAVVMFIANVLGQLWADAAFARPLSVFYYYQPQRIMLRDEWGVDLGTAWAGGRPLLDVPVVGVLLTVGAVGYIVALRVFTRRDLPAPL